MFNHFYKLLIPICTLQFDDNPVKEKQSKTQQKSVEEPAPMVRCGACQTVITDPVHAMGISGSHQHSFTNPVGVVYDIAIYSKASCKLHGPATDEHTWFPGYAWRIALCPNCQHHLGWSFRNMDGNTFYGLIIGRIVIE